MDERHAAAGLPNPTAELLIHAETAVGGSAMASALHRWRTRHSVVARSGRSGRSGIHAPLALQVDDLQGRRLADIADAGPLTRLSLPPGTCIVTATRGDIRRGYTLTLESGLSFHLHLKHSPEWP